MRDLPLRVCLHCITGRWSPIAWAWQWCSRVSQAAVRAAIEPSEPLTWADLNPLPPKPREFAPEQWIPVMSGAEHGCSDMPLPLSVGKQTEQVNVWPGGAGGFFSRAK
jgi:hypothetical protein